MEAAKNNNSRVRRNITIKYQLHQKKIEEAIEEAKQRLLALSGRLARYNARYEQHHINKTFKYNPGKVYKSFRNKEEQPNNRENQNNNYNGLSVLLQPKIKTSYTDCNSYRIRGSLCTEIRCKINTQMNTNDYNRENVHLLGCTIKNIC